MVTQVDKSDTELKVDVLAELKFEPSVKVTDIGVLVNEGVVTLTGFATSYGEKANAVRAAKRVSGARAIADEIIVKLPNSPLRTDSDIAMAVANRLDWSTMVPKGSVAISVRDGRVTLEGQVEWWYQKHDAENAVHELMGVHDVVNLITIKPVQGPSDIQASIEAAFSRNALLDARELKVVTTGNRVVLKGVVRNHGEREEAERIAWAAPGIFEVDNQIEVEWSWQSVD